MLQASSTSSSKVPPTGSPLAQLRPRSLSLQQIADRLGRSLIWVSRFENGSSAEASPEEIGMLAVLYGVSVARLRELRAESITWRRAAAKSKEKA
jgi:transcriptional regulator with XRE-family HTH domain